MSLDSLELAGEVLTLFGPAYFDVSGIRGHTGQVGDHTTCSQNEHVGEFLYFKLPNLLVQVKSSAIKDVTKYVLNTNVQFTN